MNVARFPVKTAAIIIGVCVLYLFAVAVTPGLSVPEQPLETPAPPAQDSDLPQGSAKQNVRFDARGTPISGWLCLPDPVSTPVPCIIMASGAGGTKDMGTGPYARRFREAGFAVLLFDFRHFGASGGEPRQLLSVPRQLEDFAAAIKFARGLKEIDPAKIALWGTSLSGGHVLVLAAQDPRIACVVAQCPELDAQASGKVFLKREGVAHALRLMVHGQRDVVRSWLGLSPHTIPIVGRPGTIAVTRAPEAYAAFSRLAPRGFVNAVCARTVLAADDYRPVKHAHNVRCPVLLQICDNDAFTAASAAEETARQLGRFGEIIHYPIGHFDIYWGSHFEKSVRDQLAFLRKHL